MTLQLEDGKPHVKVKNIHLDQLGPNQIKGETKKSRLGLGYVLYAIGFLGALQVLATSLTKTQAQDLVSGFASMVNFLASVALNPLILVGLYFIRKGKSLPQNRDSALAKLSFIPTLIFVASFILMLLAVGAIVYVNVTGRMEGT